MVTLTTMEPFDGVLQNRLPPDRHHALGDTLRERPEARALASSEEHGFHGLWLMADSR